MSLFKIQKNNVPLFLTLIVVLAISFFTNPSKSLAADCGVVSATFTPSGEQAENWYDDENQPNVVVDIITENCAGRTIEMSITEADTGGGDDDLPDSGLDNREVVVPTSNHIIMHLRAGEEACEGGAGLDCHYYITVYGLDTADHESTGETNGDLWYECDTTCLKNWIIGQVYTPETGDPLPDAPGTTVNTNTNYTLLAPLPGLEGPIDTLPSEANPCPFGKYLNIIIRLFLGICAVLAMVMIIAGGIEYMTSELGHSKEAGKEKITHAVLGLILALGAYAILNTLNPQLLGGICLNRLPIVGITISPSDTSTGSSTSLCISTTNPPNPDEATGTNITLNSSMTAPTIGYVAVRDTVSGLSMGTKLLITAQAYFEGYKDAVEQPDHGSKSFRTKNPGNIGNTDAAPNPWTCTSTGIRCFNTLVEGIQKQKEVLANVAGGSANSYQIGGQAPCALGDEAYNGSLYQYLRIYATGARTNNNYLNAVIGYFAQNQRTITGDTTMSQIYNMQ